jgi:glycosyltransferase involved in cell wall biosynthesis
VFQSMNKLAVVMPKPRLLFIAPTSDLKAGGEISHFELIKSAAKRGHKVYVVLPKDGYFAEQLSKHKIDHTVIPFSYWNPVIPVESTALKDMEAVLKISDYIERMHIDSVITNTLNMPWGAVAAAMMNVPHVWIAREFPLNEFKYLEDRYDFIDGFSNLVIANSKNLAKYMQDELGLTNTKHFYSYVDASLLKLNPAIVNVRLVSIGNIHSRKNQVELLQAMSINKKRFGLNHRALIIGHTFEVSYYRTLKREIKKNDLQALVDLLPFSEQPWSYVGPKDVFVQTSISESIGRTTTEAMKLGISCIGSDIPGIREAFELGGGILYKSGDPEDLARKLRIVLKNPEKYQLRAKDAQKKALNNLSEKSAHDPFFRELNKVLRSPNPRKDIGYLMPHIQVEVTNHLKALGELSRQRENNERLALEVRTLHADLDNIIYSRAWKLALLTRKLTRGG